MDRNVIQQPRCLHRRGQARKSLWIETNPDYYNLLLGEGQARKSLWIETETTKKGKSGKMGQARKSLWIETAKICLPGSLCRVRLVRACGSKQEEFDTKKKQLRSGS